MKIFIAADMEGATGVVHHDQLMPDGRGYAAAQRLLTGDVNAAIDGVLRVVPNATFVVGDGHGPMRNIILQELHESAELVIGSAKPINKPLCQLEGVDGSFDMAFYGRIPQQGWNTFRTLGSHVYRKPGQRMATQRCSGW
ncbi:MAG: M55 family metallopeptidase [Ignavibacteria bacterium]|nr:M55 family metallopeptidase [Ignavibacteria bacterium]